MNVNKAPSAQLSQTKQSNNNGVSPYEVNQTVRNAHNEIDRLGNRVKLAGIDGQIRTFAAREKAKGNLEKLSAKQEPSAPPPRR